MEFKKLPFEDRLKSSSKYLEKYPDKVPIVLYSSDKKKLIK